MFRHSHRHWLRTFASDEKEPACSARKNLTSGGDPLFHSSYDGVVARKSCPRSPSFIGPRRWKSEGTKSGLYGVCGTTVQPRLTMCSTVFRLVWGLALSCCIEKGCILLWPDSGNSSLQLSQCRGVGGQS